MARRFIKLAQDIYRDPKLRKVKPEERWVWIGLLCVAAESDEPGAIPQDLEGISFQLGISRALVAKAVETLLNLDRPPLIRREDGSLLIVRFEDHQAHKPSDDPEKVKQRVQRHREARKNEENTPPDDVTPCNALQNTPPDDVTPCNAPVTRYTNRVTPVTPLACARDSVSPPPPPPPETPSHPDAGSSMQRHGGGGDSEPDSTRKGFPPPPPHSGQKSGKPDRARASPPLTGPDPSDGWTKREDATVTPALIQRLKMAGLGERSPAWLDVEVGKFRVMGKPRRGALMIDELVRWVLMKAEFEATRGGR